MLKLTEFDEVLIRKYNQSGPRYTSYPTAVSFTQEFGAEEYLEAVRESNFDPIPRDLSLYIHIPFCDTVCYYCACNKIVTKDYSKAGKYLTRLYREIAFQGAQFDQDRPVVQLHWGGGTPTFLKRREMSELMEYTRRSFSLLDDDSGDYSIEIDPRSVTKDDIFFLRRLGFNRFSLGVQDVNHEVQLAVNRVQPIEETVAIIDACREAGAASINVDLIYGLPHQSVASFSDTLDAIIEIYPSRISVFNYAHMPHLFKPQRRIPEAFLPSSEEKLAILKLSIEKLTEAGYVYIGMDHFARPDDELVIAQNEGKLHRNFQGYSTHGGCDLVGLGVSSIGRIGNVYAQNDKTLECYYERIDSAGIATVRGIFLDDDDLLRRELIQRLTCDFRLVFVSLEKGFGISFLEYFSCELNALGEMERDGLLLVSSDSIEILPKGRLLIRSICMAFDVSLRKKGEEQRFSKVI